VDNRGLERNDDDDLLINIIIIIIIVGQAFLQETQATLEVRPEKPGLTSEVSENYSFSPP
jgi:hypothetical protein